jgi:hypothetical protein
MNETSQHTVAFIIISSQVTRHPALIWFEVGTSPTKSASQTTGFVGHWWAVCRDTLTRFQNRDVSY